MELKDKITCILRRRKSLNINDSFGIEECWNKMIKLLTKNENETICFLNQCDENDLYYISEIFEDISEILRSERFITLLRELDKKHPELNMTKDIDIAESYISIR